MTIRDTLQSRWRPEWRDHPLAPAFATALGMIAAVPAKRRSLAEPGTLSPKGLDEQMRAHAAKHFAPNLRHAQAAVDAAARGLEGRRSAVLAPPPVDKADAAGALLRGEMRSLLRGMSQGERMVAVTSDPAFHRAAMEGPAALSGLTDEQRGELARRAEPDRLASVEADSEAVELVRVAVGAAEAELRRAVAYPTNKEFDRWLAGAASNPDATSADAPDAAAFEADIKRIFDEAFGPLLSPDAPADGEPHETAYGREEAAA